MTRTNSDGQLEPIGTQYREAGLGIGTFDLAIMAPDDMVSFYETSRTLAVETARRRIELAARVR